ncbi:hypothetical protein ACC721_06650 [Rhizobium ruizarguesonis]|uniref:Uncharacterized protein n=1 Tax=Rhizobium ruizarguesonis TaxID=2081791 RepID=A0AAE4YTS4_9HYPH|nr:MULTISPECIES: hypothetical protein [Rhizobium]NEI50078.1 hypothetical protein [Rhizobium ruizarguesonis]TAU31121.1 hypothetical protein ELI47_08475 [Rhizobium ruizarguesonis]TBZ45150.1 hypothetical protein E0H44_17055 [Rhizobium leguminosarum bv. viciae]
MSGSTKSIYRVRQLVGNDGAIVTEVSEDDDGVGGYAHAKEVRNARVRLGGVDSFWLATDVKTGRKFSPSKEDTTPALFPSSSATSSLIGRIKGGSGLDFTSPFSDIAKSSKMEGISFGTAIRLPVAIGPGSRTHEDVVHDLRAGKLAVDIRSTVAAIEVRPNVFMISGFVRRSNGQYALGGDTGLRAVRTVAIVGKVETTRLASGIIVFSAQPKWTAETETDLRSNDEILASAERWLGRLRTAASMSDGDMGRSPVDFLRSLAAASVAAEEKEDLESALHVLSGRSEILDLLPKLMERDEEWRSRLQLFENAEYDRLHAEIKARLTEQMAQEASQLAELRAQILDAEGRVATLAHREVMLRNETEQHDARLKELIEDAARAVSRASLDATDRLRQEVAQLREELETTNKSAPSDDVSSIPSAQQDIPAALATAVRLPPVVTEKDRVHVLRELAFSTGLSFADLVAVLLHSTEDVPVLVGDGSAGIAADIATAIGGDAAAIVFCDPTHVSFADLLRDEAAGLRRAVDAAKENPNIIVPVALCGLTNGPCEYWLPQIVETRRIGRIPSNLALIASAGIDGLRVSVPKSVLRYLFPILVSRTETAEKVGYVGSWKPFITDATLIQNAVRILRSKSIDAALISQTADLLARVPMAMAEEQVQIATSLLAEQKWIAAWRDGADHDLIKHFQNLGN